jgi:hypothetical protein
MKIFRLIKILFAAYAAAIGITIAGIVVGAFILGFDEVDKVIGRYLIPLVIAVTIIMVPVMHKKLK